MIPVSVVIVTKDEETNIRDALESVRDFEDIVVLDAFSTDGTLAIMQGIYQPGVSAGVEGVREAEADGGGPCGEAVGPDPRCRRTGHSELKKEIAERIQEGGISGYYLPRKSFFLGKWMRHSGWWPDYILRLFRKDIAHIEPREVHEKVVVEWCGGLSEGALEHYTYRTISDYIRKMENYSTLSTQELGDKRHAPLMSMVLNPFAVFIKMFFLRQGFRDGMHGFILAGLYSFYTFLKYAKIWEKRRGGVV